MCLAKASQASEQEAKVIFNEAMETFMPRLLKMETGRRKLEQGAVQVVFTLLCQTQILQNQSVGVVKLAFQRMVATCLEQGRGLAMQPQCFAGAIGALLHHRLIQKSSKPLFALQIS